MAYFPPSMPAPEPEPVDQEFWAHCAQGHLRFQTCSDCDTPRHPPTPMCPSCHSTRTEWVDPGKTAEVFSYTVIHHASHEAVPPNLPYVVAVVTFPALPGVRLITNLTDLSPGDVRIGHSVTLWFDDIGDGMQVPRFRPEGAA